MAAQDAWVSDGNYGKVLPTWSWSRATTSVWLDYEQLGDHAAGDQALAHPVPDPQGVGTGNVETWSNWLARTSIRWAWDVFEKRRKRYEEAFPAEPPHGPSASATREADPLIRRLVG